MTGVGPLEGSRMDDRDSAARPRRRRRSRMVSTTAAAAEDHGASESDDVIEVVDFLSPRETHPGADRPSAADRRNSALQANVHHRHMPMEPLKFHIPRKTKEKRALFQYVSTESREYEDMMTILTSSYVDTNSAGCFTYCKPRLVHSELQEKEFVEKRKEMKADGRTDKELEESYCFLLSDAIKLPLLCEKGLFVGQSWLTVLGHPSKGVYLSRYSDLLQVNHFTPGATWEIIIFKVMKGKVKSIYENMKNLIDPTPRFDSHLSKNASKVTSLNSFRAFELTQQYFYEYEFDELRQRPRQVCPYAVVSFQFKGKDSPLPSKPLAPIRSNSQSAEQSKEQTQFTVWTGDLVKGDRVLYQIALRSFSPPFLPHRLPEKLEIGWLMRLDKVTELLPSDLFSYNLYKSSHIVVKSGHCCSLLEVIDRSRSMNSVIKLLQELEMKRVVLVTPLSEKGFLFLLSSVQMATPNEREENWKRCLQALFIFPESRDLANATSRCASSSHDATESGSTVMPRLNQFIPALHHALVKARANPPPELSAGVERQAREYLIGQNDGKVRQYPMGEYDSKLDEDGKLFPAPKHHRLNMDGYLHSYLYSPALYMLSVARARQMVEAQCVPKEPQEVKPRKSCGGQREAMGNEATSNTRDRPTKEKMQQLLDLILTCKRNAENEVKREEGRDGGLKVPGRKRKLEQETAERALKFLKASQEPRGSEQIAVDGSQVLAPPGSLASVIGSVGLKDTDLRDGSELATKLLNLLTGLNQAATGTANQSPSEVQEESQRESCPFDRLATKLGLPTNCDIDLRKQEELEEQTAGSVSSLEGFSPGSHSGEMMNHHGAAGRGGGGGGGGLGRRTGGFQEEEEQWMIPWVLIPITGLCSKRYTQRDRNIPQDPRFHHLATATAITTSTKPPRKSPTPSPVPSPPPSPSLCPSPDPSPPPSPSQCPSPEPSPPPSPSQCPSPDPSPPPSPSQCPSPQPSPPLSPSQCTSPQPSPPLSPSQCPSPQPSPPTSPSQCPSPQPSPHPSPSQCPTQQPSHPPPSSLSPSVQLSPPPSPSRCQSPESNELSPLNKDRSRANEERLAPTASREFAGISKDREEKPQGKEKKNGEPSISASNQPFIPPVSERTSCLPSLPEREVEDADKREMGKVKDTQTKLLGERKETQVEKVCKRGEDEVKEGKQDEVEVVDMICEESSDKEQKGDSKELVGGSSFSLSTSSPSARPLRDIDSIVDKHLGDFSSELQLLLQEESVYYSCPQSPHSTSNTEISAPKQTFPNTSISQFSQYVSFYHTCPPVQDYVSSLQDSIDCMMTEFDGWQSSKPDTRRTETDATLANNVSAFVAGIRAGNAKTGSDDEASAPCGELTAAGVGASVSVTPALSKGSEGWRPDSITKQVPDAANNRNPPTSNVTLSVPTSASGCSQEPANTAVLHPPPNKSSKCHWTPQQSHSTLEINRTVSHNVRQTPHNSTNLAVHIHSGIEAGSSLAGAKREVTIPGFSSVSKPSAESSPPSERVSSPASGPLTRPGTSPAPPVTALSSLISQLQPEVFNSLVEIIKDVKRNSLQFYLHSTEPEDQVYEDVREYLLKQGNVEQSPVAFMNQENSDNKLLVVIKNKDIAGHIHKVPGLMSLKRRSSVVFVGIDTLDDIRNNSYNELFVSGGCIVSDEFLLNPDFISPDRLASLLMFLEKHSSLDSVWRWRVHCKTHKKLKEQARFRRDAANLLDILSVYQKRQVVEFLPYHHCDMMNHQSSDLDCLIELQARYTQYRHTIFLTDHHFEKFPAYSSSGIIVASIEEILHNFTKLVGYHDIKDKQPIIDNLIAPKGVIKQRSDGDCVSGSERSPSIFPEHIHPLSSGEQAQHLLQQPGSSLPHPPHLSDQLVPEASCKEGMPNHSDTDLEILQMAISQLRAERQAQQQQLQKQFDAQADFSINPCKIFLPCPVRTDGSQFPPSTQAVLSDSVQINPGRKAVAATLELIHSKLQTEQGEEQRREHRDGAKPPTEGQRKGGEAGSQRGDTPVRVVGSSGRNQGPSNSDISSSVRTSTTSSNQNTAAAPSGQTDSTSYEREKADQRGECALSKAAKDGAMSSSSTSCPLEGDISRDTQSGQEPPVRGEGSTPGYGGTVASRSAQVKGSITMVTDQKDNPNQPAQPGPQPIQQPQHLQQLSQQQQPSEQIRQSASYPPPPLYSQQWLGDGLLHRPHLPLPPPPMPRPLAPHGRARGLLGTPPVWSGGLGPRRGTLVWGFQRTGRDVTGSALLGDYHTPAGQSSHRHRGGGQRGGFNGM
ncbi:uncharacterized protein tasora [Scomber scombrus]|uniref:uncharacterized protein tasora n=1 Tax=Scomber scombrus TaxID=13677 RepID=UPI002DD7FF8C|nr:uncharacterized protein tasora [Scomber scombrus]